MQDTGLSGVLSTDGICCGRSSTASFERAVGGSPIAEEDTGTGSPATANCSNRATTGSTDCTPSASTT